MPRNLSNCFRLSFFLFFFVFLVFSVFFFFCRWAAVSRWDMRDPCSNGLTRFIQFYSENVFRVTLLRKSKFGGLNWVLFHALRSPDCPLQQPRLLLQPSAIPTILPLYLALSKSAATTYSRFLAGSLLLFGRFLLYFRSFLSFFFLIKIAGRYGLRRAMQ